MNGKEFLEQMNARYPIEKPAVFNYTQAREELLSFAARMIEFEAATDKAILLSIRDHEVETSLFPTYEKAYEEMEKALHKKMKNGEEDGSSCSAKQYKRGEDYEIKDHVAWLNNYSDYDWIIVETHIARTN